MNSHIVQALRVILLNGGLYLNTIAHMIVCLPVLFMPRRFLWRAVDSWVSVNHWLLWTICGIDFDIRGAERLPSGPLLVAVKHQSTWETYSLLYLFSDPAYVLKRELMWLPIFGWYCIKARMIPVRRGARAAALAEMTERARKEIADGRQIAIFPEGTRRAPDAEPSYKYGVAHLYGELAVPCVPIALNSGLYWPRRSWRMRPGTIRVEILDPIPPGLHPDAFLIALQNQIEPATARLVSQGRSEIEAYDRQVAFRSTPST
jgi:1-acyl-sn-glycerol-3-phosphate acyltransferase